LLCCLVGLFLRSLGRCFSSTLRCIFRSLGGLFLLLPEAFLRCLLCFDGCLLLGFSRSLLRFLGSRFLLGLDLSGTLLCGLGCLLGFFLCLLGGVLCVSLLNQGDIRGHELREPGIRCLSVVLFPDLLSVLIRDVRHASSSVQ
jgi:hypothetical protein